MERSHSGLVRRTRNAVRSQGLREFESLPLRHKKTVTEVAVFLMCSNNGVSYVWKITYQLITNQMIGNFMQLITAGSMYLEVFQIQTSIFKNISESIFTMK